ncbi:hypothetical protein WJX72_004883 [[Myrmecia] bisecta]|uniref:Uncharacterized protein n=1 Tax=[Myrmecia] bisecta TaxID=41462 RepID=A0AAW1PX62_9CHLO
MAPCTHGDPSQTSHCGSLIAPSNCTRGRAPGEGAEQPPYQSSTQALPCLRLHERVMLTRAMARMEASQEALKAANDELVALRAQNHVVPGPGAVVVYQPPTGTAAGTGGPQAPANGPPAGVEQVVPAPGAGIAAADAAAGAGGPPVPANGPPAGAEQNQVVPVPGAGVVNQPPAGAAAGAGGPQAPANRPPAGAEQADPWHHPFVQDCMLRGTWGRRRSRWIGDTVEASLINDLYELYKPEDTSHWPAAKIMKALKVHKGGKTYGDGGNRKWPGIKIKPEWLAPLKEYVEAQAVDETQRDKHLLEVERLQGLAAAADAHG